MDAEVVRMLARNPRCLDLYTWLTWRCHQAKRLGTNLVVRIVWLEEQNRALAYTCRRRSLVLRRKYFAPAFSR